MVVRPFQLPALWSRTLFQILSEPQQSVQTVSDIYFKCICLLDRVCKPAYLVPIPSQDKLGGLCQEGHLAPISLDGVAVRPDCWCICLCYLHFAPENPEDGEMYLLVPAQSGCPGQSPEICKTIVCICLLDTSAFGT